MAASRIHTRILAWASGRNRARQAIEAALAGAHGRKSLAFASRVVIGIACDETLRLEEIEYVMHRVMDLVPEEVPVSYGTRLDRDLDGGLRVSIGLSGPGRRLH